MPIFQLYHGDQFLVVEEAGEDHGQATGKLYHLRLRVDCILFCNLQAGANTRRIGDRLV